MKKIIPLLLICYLYSTYLLAQDTLYATSFEYMLPGSFDRYTDLDRIIIENNNCKIETVSTFAHFQLFGSIKEAESLDLIINKSGQIYIFFIDGTIYELDLITNELVFFDQLPFGNVDGGRQGAVILNDTTWLISGGEVYSYHVPSKSLSGGWGGVPGYNNGAVPDLTLYNGEVIFTYNGVPQYHDFYRLNLDDTPVTVDSLFSYAPVGNLDYIYGLASIPKGCDSAMMYGVSFERFINTHPTFVTQIDIENGTSTRICPVDKIYTGLASTYELDVFPCQLLIDLDADDSSGTSGQDYADNSVCPNTIVPISDVDGLIESERPLDSLRVHFQAGHWDGAAEQLLFTAPGPWTGEWLPNGDLVLRFPVAAQQVDWSIALQQIQYVHTANLPTPGLRTFELIAYSATQSDTAYAYLQVLAGVSAGRDTSLQFCASDAGIDLSNYLAGATSLDGEWLPDGTAEFDPSTAPAQSLLYYVVSHNQGCSTDTARFTITVEPGPAIDLGPDRTLCAGDSLYLAPLGGGYASYTWSDGHSTLNRILTGAGVYAITVTDILGCTTSAAIAISLSDVQPIIYGDSLLCPDALPATFQVTPYPVILWSTGATTPSTLLTTVGPLQVYVEDTLGCSGSSSWLVQQSDPLLIDIAIRPATCAETADGAIELAGVEGGYPPYTVELEGQWILVGESIDKLNSGQYSIEVTDSESCLLDSVLYIPAGLIQKMDLGPDLVFVPGDDLRITHRGVPIQVPIEWQVEGAVAEYESSATDLLLQELSGTIQVIASASSDEVCIEGDTLLVTYQPDYDIFVPNAFSPNSDGINDVLSVFCRDTKASVLQMQVFDRWGGLVWEGVEFSVNDNSQGWDGLQGFDSLHPGVYVWTVELQFSDGKVKTFSGDVLLMR